MKNTKKEIEVYTSMFDELEEALFAKLRSFRGIDFDKAANLFQDWRTANHTTFLFLNRLFSERWHLNSSYGFSHLDEKSDELITEICKFTGIDKNALIKKLGSLNQEITPAA
jgi:hypothetical protein